MPERTLFCVTDDNPEETTRLLRQACDLRGIHFVEVEAATYIDNAAGPQSGDLLFRAAGGVSAMRVEQAMYREGVATFYRDSALVFLDVVTPSLVHARAGIPIPRTVFCATTDRAVLARYATMLGGFPIVAKLCGEEGGAGVSLLETEPGLLAFCDRVIPAGGRPLLCEFIADAVHWRVVVVGDRAVAAYINPRRRGDFRTQPSGDVADYTSQPDGDVAALAVAATSSLGVAFGGVDLLRTRTGRLVVLEVNFPCYFAQAHEIAGIDVAGAMVDWLAANAARLGEPGVNAGPGLSRATEAASAAAPSSCLPRP
jgi:glutathione synthase/RimK-type ligase-like ATP-grasp enzyme